MHRAMLHPIQILRGWAAVLVVLYHLGLHMGQWFRVEPLGGALQAANIGVDLFFVISGFIIHHVHGRDLGQPSALRPFLIRRLIRIFPLYWVILLLTLLQMRALSLGIPWADLPAAALLLLPAAAPVVAVAWTLSYEMIFYLAYAALLPLGPRWAPALLALWALASLLSGWSSGWMILSPWVAEFCAGALLAHVLRDRPSLPPWIFTLVLLAYLAGVMVMGRPAEHLPAEHRSALMLGAALLVALAAVTRSNSTAGPAEKLFRLLGDASYSLYLTHYLFIQSAYTLVQHFGLLGRLNAYAFNFACLLPATLVFGLAFHVLVEKPLLAACRRRFRRWGAAAPTLG